MSNLRTLALINCNNTLFVHTLDPEQNKPGLVLCPIMEELILYVQSWSLPDVKHLIRMARNRASRGARLASVTIIDLSGCEQVEEVSP